ncbi:MAG: thioredoxin fold domain-containing protein [Pirellulaceae bacterium]|nr:thioredoxin fold domain-containing protein [Pirellulaceae bacterium]
MRQKRNFLWLVMILGVTIASVAPANEIATPVAVDSTPTIEWEELVKAWKASADQKKPLLIFLTMDSCRMCEKMKRDTLIHPDIVENVTNSFVAVQVNRKDALALVRKTRVRKFPTTLIIEPQGKVLDSITGYRKPAEFLTRLETASRKAALAERTARRESSAQKK